MYSRHLVNYCSETSRLSNIANNKKSFAYSFTLTKLRQKKASPQRKLAKSIQNECNNMSQSINHQKGQKVVYSG